MRASASPLFRAGFASVAYAAVTIATGVPSQAQVERLTPVTDAMLQDPDPADWLMWRRTLDSWGYSPLDQAWGLSSQGHHARPGRGAEGVRLNGASSIP